MYQSIKVIERSSNTIKIATYAANSKGNLRYFVEGLFYSDRKFDKTFKILTNEEGINNHNPG